ncbi:MAG: efflux RND transporter permease subunit [Thermoguttaceae bacterium]|nr:efflux RND transporter permease subunit [Thermoguttaceae bacterium]
MLNRIIRFSLANRFLIVVGALLFIAAGLYRAAHTSIDVLPDLNRPRVTIMTECPGMAPEEVETLVTLPLETALVGTTGIEALRSSSVVGLSTVVAEFDWSSDLYLARQIVFERTQRVADELPEGVFPRMTPVTSVTGQALTLAIYSENGKTSPMDLRALADWDVRRKILAQKGVSEVYSMGGERRQYQVALRPDDLLRFGLTVDDVETALRKSNRNVTAGFLTRQGPKQFLARSLGRIKSLDDLRTLVVDPSTEPPILLPQVADVKIGPSVPIGDSSAAIRLPDGSLYAGDAVVLTVEKQPNQDARQLTQAVLDEMVKMETKLRQTYPDLRIVPVYQQRTFVELAVKNVLDALRDGAFLVAIVVFLFLASWRATFVTLITIPTTLATACLIFAAFGMTINAMTLGGLAVAIGELVDDAIVDVENIYRRLGENALLETPRRTLNVVFEASSEIRNSIVNGTAITVLVFFPLFFLDGIEGKLFAPLGLAYIVSISSSLLVSLTLTPALSHVLFPAIFRRRKSRSGKALNPIEKREKKPSLILRTTRYFASSAIRCGLDFPLATLFCAAALGVGGLYVFLSLDRDFMPPFNEGAIQVNLDLAPGVSLETSSEVAEKLALRLAEIEGIAAVVRKTGRSEMDEHAVPVNTSEFVCTVDQTVDRDFNEIVDEVRAAIDSENIPGAVASYDQPLQHLINHLRSGTRAKIAIKVAGDELPVLRQRVAEIKKLVEDVDDIGSLRVEPIQADLPQVQIRLKRDALARYGLTPQDVDQTIEIAMNGSVATTVLEGERPVELLTRLGEDVRENIELLRRLPIRLPEKTKRLVPSANPESTIAAAVSGENDATSETSVDYAASQLGVVPLSEVAEIDAHAFGPGQIDRENARRQVVIQSNPRYRGAVEVKKDVDARLATRWNELTADGVDVRVSGLFESEQSASRTLTALSLFSGLCVFLILFRMFRSANLALQVMAIVPLALVGAVGALWLTGQSRTIPALVGMISLCGVASRNGVLLLERYLHLAQYEGETLSKSMILRAGRERVAPVLMTALTSAIGLLPLAAAPNLPGREILYPIATVMIGGLTTSTALEFFVRPALFWRFGLKSARRVLAEAQAENERARSESRDAKSRF